MLLRLSVEENYCGVPAGFGVSQRTVLAQRRSPPVAQVSLQPLLRSLTYNIALKNIHGFFSMQ